jgi:hypothetical protein
VRTLPDLRLGGNVTITLRVVLVLLSLILFGVAAFGVPAGRFGLIAGGLFLWELSTVVAG